MEPLTGREPRRQRVQPRVGTLVRGQRWADVAPVHDLAGADLSVTVVIPARDCQDELDRTLAALAFQSYPAELLDVIVVDDSSEPPLVLSEPRPVKTQLVRRAGGESHGSGPARHLGATQASGDVLLFLDADMVADTNHVAGHMAWHRAMDHALVLGIKRFVDFDGIGPLDVAEAVRSSTLAALLQDRRSSRHQWQEDLIREHGLLSMADDEAFIAVVGADLSLRSELYAASGGFSPFGLRGIVDTEFGYRAYTRGAVLVPEQMTLAYHQGRRSFTTSGDEIKRKRTGLAANHLPVPLFRPSNRNRGWAVPSLVVFVEPTQGGSPECTQVAVDAVLASDLTDLVVRVVETKEAPLPRWLHDYFEHDGRVAFTAADVTRTGFPSPYTVHVRGDVAVRASTLSRMLEAMSGEDVGAVRTEAVSGTAPGVAVYRTRALERTLDYAEAGLAASVGSVFGERLVRAADVGAGPATYSVTKQGMLRSEPA